MKKRDIPKEIEIADGVWYKIVWKRAKSEFAQKYHGMIFFDKKEIWISQGMDIEETLATLWHELAHGIEHEYGINIGHKMIYQIEGPLAFLAARNTFWIKWLETKK